MKCSEANRLIAEFKKSLPPLEHEWVNVATHPDYEKYICYGCDMVGTKTLSNDGVTE